MSRIAVFGGSFDPIHKGHEWTLEQAAGLFDQVIFTLTVNAEKAPRFSQADRLKMMEESVAHLRNVEVAITDQFLVNYARQRQAQYFVRGLRTAGDWEYEHRIEKFNLFHAPEILTIYLSPPSNLDHVSSSFVHGLVGFQEWHEAVQPYISPWVYQAYLRRQFDKLWQQRMSNVYLASKADIAKQAFTAYQQPGRHYHNATHVVKMLEELGRHTNLTSSVWVMALAIIGHDLVYDPLAPDNEERSVELISTKLYPEMASKVAPLIMATKHHQPQNQDERLMVDLDLSILGQPESVYDQYAANIRLEYGMYAADEYNAGRAKVLQGFLDRPQIYHTDSFFDQYEIQARANIARELQQLQPE